MENYLIQQFTNELLGNVRSIVINNEPWFVGKDIATCLGYTDTDQAIRKHVDLEDKIGGGVDSTGASYPIVFTDSSGRQQVQYPVWINESGLYSLIFSSKLPAAKEFKHWVTSQVLPTMRKIGFNNSMRILMEENIKLNEAIESYEANSYGSNIREAYVTSELYQIKSKIKKSDLPEDLKTFLTTFDENWED